MEISGVPLHPLVIHVVVMLVPVAVVAGWAHAFLTGWRWLTRWVALGATVGALVAVYVARQSGEQLLEARPYLVEDPTTRIARLVETHQDRALILFYAMVALTVVSVVAFWLLPAASGLASGRLAHPGREGVWLGRVLQLSYVVVGRVALADPEPRTGLVDRALAAAYDAGIDPLLCLTKADLAGPEPLLEIYRPLDVPFVVTQRGGDVTPVRAALAGRTSVLLGHSGVGKSTLVNALVPEADRETGLVNAVTGRGRHTSTNALMLALPGGGWIVDTPGIRSFGLAHVDPDHLIEAFPDLVALTDACPRGCTHATGEPECGLDRAEGDLAVRVESFRRLLDRRQGETA
jgi:ribosome small subunit-dependent GTPase A